MQYRPWALQHLHVCKLHATWRINMQNTHKKHVSEILCEQLHAASITREMHVFIV